MFFVNSDHLTNTLYDNQKIIKNRFFVIVIVRHYKIFPIIIIFSKITLKQSVVQQKTKLL